MKNIYPKVILTLYPSLGGLIEEFDERVERRALRSIDDCSSCLSICEDVIRLIREKDLLIELFTVVEEVLSQFTKENMRFFDFRYFGKRSKELTQELKYPNSYFFKHLKDLTVEFADKMAAAGVTEERFEKEFMKVDVIKAVAQAIADRENRNKRSKKKERLISNAQKTALSKTKQKNARVRREKGAEDVISDKNYSKSFSS